MNEDQKARREQVSVLGMLNLGGIGGIQVEVSSGKLKLE